MRSRNSQHHYPLSGDLEIIQDILCNIVEDAYDALAPHTSRADLLMDLSTINRRLSCEGLRFATEILPNIGKAFLAYVETGVYPDLGIKIRGKSPIFLRGLFVCYESNYRKTEAFRAIYQITSLFKKLRGDYKPGTVINMIKDFIDNDERLHTISQEVKNNPSEVLKLARHFIRNDFQDFDLSHHSFVGRPGPGATCNPTSRNLRYEPQVLYTKHDDTMPYAEWFYPLLTDVNHRARHFRELMQRSQYEPSARYKVVPKTWNKGRGICIEENESQFLQQALAKGIRWKIDNSYLRKYIQIDNQNLNAQHALQSSKTGKNATIDMSDASDCISRVLVLYLFQDTMLHDALDAAATRLINFDDQGTQLKTILAYNRVVEAEQRIPLGIKAHKFAPMGSGLCFPIMTLVHYYLIKAIICRHHNVLPKEAGNIYVYGDDIVLPSEYAKTVFTELPKYGMKLNQNKSFFRSKFRESCGIHAYNGVNVTPVYAKHIPNTTKPTALHSCAVAEYHLRKLRYIKCANAIRRMLLLKDSNITWVPPGKGVYGIYSDTLPTVPPFKRKWFNHTQDDRGNPGSPVYCVRVPTLVQRTNSSRVSTQTGALMRYWGVHSKESDWVSDVPHGSEVQVKWMWRPVSAIYS